MKNKNYLTLFKIILLGLIITIVTKESHSQILNEKGQSLVGKGQSLIGKFGDKKLVKKITAIELTYNNGYIPLVWTTFDLQVEATLKNGKKKWTGNGTKNNISWENYTIVVEGGIFDPESGILEITDKNGVSITATLTSFPNISNSINIQPIEVTQISLSKKMGVDVGTFLVTANAILSDSSTISTNNGRLQWRKLDIVVNGAKFSDGKLILPEQDYRDIEDDKISLNAKVRGKEDISYLLDIPLEYEGKITTYYNGNRGRTGQNGAEGTSGVNGKAGAGDRAGGDGGHGQRGADGSFGGDGSNAENLEVHIGLAKNKTNDKDILKVYIKSLSTGKESYLKIAPEKGELYIYAQGGNGGSGGRGGNGGTGGVGGGGTVSGKNGNGGDGGNGGNGGYGGNGGNVKLIVHPMAKKYMSCIIIYNDGGKGGDQGSMGSGGQCSSNASNGKSGKFGNVGGSGADGNVNIIEKEVKFDW